MSLTRVQTDEILRFLGYPSVGAPPGDVALGYPGFASVFMQWQPYAWLVNYRFPSITPNEEVMLMGAESPLWGSYLVPASTSLAITTPSEIAVGAQLQVDLDEELIVYTAIEGDTPTSVATAVAQLIAQNATSSQVFIAQAVDGLLTFYARALGSAGNGLTYQAVSSDPTLQVAAPMGAPGAYAISSTAGGTNPPGERFQPDGSSDYVYGYVPIIRILQGDLINARDNLDIKQADVYTPRPDEVPQRRALLRRYRRLMAEMLNTPLDPDLVGNKSGGMRFR